MNSVDPEIVKQALEEALKAPRWHQRRTDTASVVQHFIYTGLLGTQAYAEAMRFVEVFEHPQFHFKEAAVAVPDLTNRKINEWDSIGLISGQRKNKEAGWRKYSPIEVILLNIITDLRAFGFDTKSIKKVLASLRTEAVEVNGEQKRVDPLGFFFWLCISGFRIVLIIDEHKKPRFCDEASAMRLHFVMDQGTRPILILPFSNYFERLAEAYGKEGPYCVSELAEMYELREKFTEEERSLLRCLWNPKTAKVEVSKAPGRKMTVKTYERESGDMDEEKLLGLLQQARQSGFGTVTINVTDGKYSRVEVAQSKKL